MHCLLFCLALRLVACASASVGRPLFTLAVEHLLLVLSLTELTVSTTISTQAFKNLDWSQFKLVFEALHERNVLLKNVPYLSNPLPIMTVRLQT